MNHDMMPLSMMCGEEPDLCAPSEGLLALSCEGCRMKCILMMQGEITPDEASALPCILNAGCLDVEWKVLD